MRSFVRSAYVLAALAIVLLVLQPGQALAGGPSNTFTVTKSISNGFSCTAPGNVTGLTYSSAATAAPGQCVAISVGIVNNSMTAITGLTLADSLSFGLTGCSYTQGATSATCPAPGTANTGCYYAAASQGGYTCTVTSSGLSFSTNGVAGYTCTASSAPGCNEYFVARVANNVCGMITNVGTGSVTSPTGFGPTNPSATNSAIGSASATLNVTCPNQLTKSVSQAFQCGTSPGFAFGSSTTARPGDCVAVRVGFTNNSSTAVTSFAISDNLAGAGLLGYGTTCVQPTTTSYGGVTCSVSAGGVSVTNSGTFSLGNGQTQQATFIVRVPTNAACNSTLTNTAAVSVNGGTPTATPSATIGVVCQTPPPVVYPSSFIVCGLISGYTAGQSITVNGQVFPLTTGTTLAVAPGLGFVLPLNACVTFTVVNGAIVALQVTPNLATLIVVCGALTTVTTTTTTTTIVVAGMSFPVASGMTVTTLTYGVTYCFVLNSQGYVIAILTGIPTSIHPFRHHVYDNRPGFFRAS